MRKTGKNWGYAVVNQGKACASNRNLSILNKLSVAVGVRKVVGLYKVLPDLFHGPKVAFQSVNLIVIPTIHSTYNNYEVYKYSYCSNSFNGDVL